MDPVVDGRPPAPSDEARRDLRKFRTRLRERQLALKRRLSPFLLLDERDGPLVRALMISTRKRRRIGAVICALLPLSLFAAAVLAFDPAKVGALTGLRVESAAGIVLCLWPAVMFMGAALASAGATVSERTSGSVVQLVLSPIAKRDIAASKVLPHVLPFLLGIAAALPLYLWAGASPDLLIEGKYPGPQAAWPTRAFILLNNGGDWQLAVTPTGLTTGILMFVGDLATVWAAAHWGAGLAVRLGKLTLVAGYLLGRGLLLIFFTLIAWSISWIGGAFVGSVVYGITDSRIVGLAVGVLFATGVYLVEWWAFLYFWPVAGALEEFESFDRLADEDFRPRLWERFNSRKFREHIRIRRH